MVDRIKQRFEELKASGMLPSPKGVAVSIVEIASQPDASLKAVTHLIQMDPALAGRILHYANVSGGGSMRHIASVTHAITFLGLFRVRQIALGFSLIENYRTGACRAFDYGTYWATSLATGIAAEQIAPLAHCPEDESFTCGLLSGVGRLALATAFPKEYSKLLEQHPDAITLRQSELELFGIEHASLSAEMLKNWGLPEIFTEAVHFHESPTEAPFAPGSRAMALTSALHCSLKVAQLLNFDDAHRWEQVHLLYHAAAQLGLETADVAPLIEKVVENWQRWGKELQLVLPSYKDIPSLLTPPAVIAAEGNAQPLTLLPMRTVLLTQPPHSLDTLTKDLEALGLHVTNVRWEDAHKALIDTPPDLVIADLGQGGSKADEQLRALRAMTGPNLHCIALIAPEAEPSVAKLMQAGASDYLCHGYPQGALLARLSNAQRLVALQGMVRSEREMAVDVSEEWARTNRRLLHDALTDPLTQLPNRRYGMDRFAQEWSVASSNNQPLAAMMLDIDHFKRVNDERGHEMGDLVLRQIAAVFESTCRKSDCVFRYGGEEFCVICPSTSRADATHLADRILLAVRQEHFGIIPNNFPLTISIGIAARNDCLQGPEDLIACADKALYRAKETGRNCTAWFD